ncbi:hypothetical protein H3C66_01225 [Patescibacteria group bacterium]|nr:hypothetical protein [Patescibacteria group bacterium]
MKNFLNLNFTISKSSLQKAQDFAEQYMPYILFVTLSVISVFFFYFYYHNQLGLAYNDARSHLDIGRRVVEGLKPGAAQLGSVWLPLPHILMIPTIWNDFMWHSGLSGAVQSMVSFVVTGLVIYSLLGKLKVGLAGRLFGVLVFCANMNILYLQSTAMTELLLIGVMTLGVYELILWHQDGAMNHLIKSSFWIMLSTLVRYDGWFLFMYSTLLVIIYGLRKKSWKMTEGLFILFCTLGGFGIFFWVVWNAAIFKDPLYFIFGPYSAHAQQTQLEGAGVLATKHDLILSTRMYTYALVYNSGMLPLILSGLGLFVLLRDKALSTNVKIGATSLLAPLIFNILALYLGHSVLFIQGISGNTWFNVRYGIMMMSSIAILAGYFFYKAKLFRPVILALFIFVTIFHFGNGDAVTIDDGRVGSSQKNVSEVSGWLNKNTANEKGFILISAASHDAIIFSSGLPMKRYIHEGTGAYWESATASPDRWARWIVMRTNDVNDQTFRLLNKDALEKYELVNSYPFADIYQLKAEFIPQVNTEPVLGKQK